MKRKRGRKSVCVTAKQRTEAAFFRVAIRRVFQSILDDMRAEMRRKLDEPTIVDHFCDAVIGAMHEMAARPLPPGPHAYVTEEPYGHQK